MANEFIIKNGYFSQGNSNITGSLIVSASGTANDLLIGTNKLFVSASGNVGIGTTTSGYKLSVQTSEPAFGIVQAISNNNGSNATSGSKILWDQSGIGNFWEGMPGGVNAWAVGLYNGSTNPEYLRIGSTGNVGIGTTSPSAKLHVSGGITSTDTIAIEKGASDTIQQGSSVYLIGGSGASYTQLQQGVGRFTIWGYNGSAWGEKFTINNTSGNVGIGTASPNSKLDVAGSINIASGLGNASTRPTIAAGTLTAGEIRAYSTNFGNTGDDGFVRISAGGGTATNVKSYIDITGYSTVADMNKNIVLGTSGVERMRIDANGNVGIGTSTPTQKLTVATGNITADDYYFNNVPNTAVARRYVGGVVGISNAGYTTICNVVATSLSSGIRIALMGTTTAVVVNVVADILVNHFQDIYIESKSGIYTLLTLKVISNNDGSFTIQATTDSSTPVQLNVEVFPLNSETITFNPGSTYSGTTLIHPCVPGLNISATGGDASTNGNLSVSGRIGIGTTAPNSKLTVNGNTSITGSLTVASTNTGPTDILLVGSTVGNGSIAIQAASTDNYAYQTFYQGNVGKFEMGIVPTTSDYYINPNLQNGSTGAAIYIKKSDGNVGIGTTNPNAKLHVNGGVLISGSSNGIAFDNPLTLSAGLLFKSDGSNIWSINKGAGDGTENWNFYNYYRSKTDFSVNNLTGNVGIGTSTPNAKLDVNGNTIITGSLSNGLRITASGSYSHAEGYQTVASGSYSHTEGNGTLSIGSVSHAEGQYTTTYGDYSHTEGEDTIARGNGSHAEGFNTIASGSYSHTEGSSSIAIGQYSHAEGRSTVAIADYSHAEGYLTRAAAIGAHVEGERTYANFPAAHAEGYNTSASADYAHAEGNITIARGLYSHAEGVQTTTNAQNSHAEGYGSITTAFAVGSHAEGYFTTTRGAYSHAEGSGTITSGSYSHTEGRSTVAIADYSHAEGFNTITSGSYQTVVGQYNRTFSAESAFIIGNGNSTTRSNLVFASGSTFQVTGSVLIQSGYNLGIGIPIPTYQLQLSTDSAGKLSTSTWSITSDIRLKENIQEANYDTCYDIIKNLPLNRYTWKDAAYTTDQITDRSKLGWIAQDVETVFPKAVGIHPFSGSGDFYIEDCRDLDVDQIYAAMYGTIKKLINENDTLKSEIQAIKTHIGL